VTGLLALVAALALNALGWPLTGVPADHGAAGVAAGRVLSGAFVINLVALLANPVPVRPLDGAHLLAAARLRRDGSSAR
jgi:Zn-dependent protease